MKTFFLVIAGCFLVLSLVIGCSPPRYPNKAEKNLTVTSRIEHKKFSLRTGFFAKAEAFVGIHKVDADCESKYLGYLPLERGFTEIGLPPDQLTLLAVEIAFSSLGDSRRITRQALIKPERDKSYQLNLSYVDDMFDLNLQERGSTAGPGELEVVPLSACRKFM